MTNFFSKGAKWNSLLDLHKRNLSCKLSDKKGGVFTKK